MNRPITIAICLFIILILTLTLIYPKYQNLKSVQEKILEKRAELQYKEEYFSNLTNLSAQLKKYSDNLSKIDSALPSGPSLPALLEFLQKTSSESGLIFKKIGLITSNPVQGRERLKEHSLDLSLSGSYSSFKSFLSSLEKTARLIETESISFSFLKGEPFDFSLRIKFYSY